MTSTTSTDAVAWHREVCATLRQSTETLADIVAACDSQARPPGMRWTNAEIAIHLALTAAEGVKAAHGESNWYNGGFGVEPDDALVATCPERDPKVLADLIRDHLKSFVDVAESMDPTTATTSGGLSWNDVPTTVGTIAALLTLDHPLHGGQIARTSGARWTDPPTGMPYAIATVVPFVFDPAASGGFNGTIALRFRGAEPVRFTIADQTVGDISVGRKDNVDCRISVDPQTFLGLGIGVVKQSRAVLTGRMVAYGRKPWLAARFPLMFPPVPHGGVAN